MPEPSEIKIEAPPALAPGEKKLVKAGDSEYLLIQLEDALLATEPKCPHAGAPLEQGALCGHRLTCPWHMGQFELPSGALLEPPPFAALKVYDVRREGTDLFLNPEPRTNSGHAASQQESQTILLAGLGAAGTTAALTLRHGGFTGRICAVDPVPQAPIDRTQLSKNVLAGKMPLEKVALPVLKDLKIEHLESPITRLSAAHKQVTLADGQTFAFDQALIATGGHPKRPELPGAELAFTLRQPADVEAILAHANKGDHAVIIGTSFIGMECATSLTQLGLHVTVVGDQPKLAFNQKFGDRVGDAIAALYRKNNVTLELDAKALRISRSGVTIEQAGQQKELPATLVVLGVGVSPKLDFDHDLPFAPAKPNRPQDGSIATDESLVVAPGVFVAGDIAGVSGVRIEHWRLAQQHGIVAAHAMLGQATGYHGVPFFWTFHFGKRFGYLGHADTWDEIVFDGEVEALTFLAFYVKDGKVAAVLSCGRDHDTAVLHEVMKEKPTLAELRSHLAPAQGVSG